MSSFTPRDTVPIKSQVTRKGDSLEPDKKGAAGSIVTAVGTGDITGWKCTGGGVIRSVRIVDPLQVPQIIFVYGT